MCSLSDPHVTVGHLGELVADRNELDLVALLQLVASYELVDILQCRDPVTLNGLLWFHGVHLQDTPLRDRTS